MGADVIVVSRWHDERGQAVPLVAVVVVIAVVLTAAMGHFGRDVVDAGRARTAADAAALAGVEGGRAASARLAAEHGAELVAWSRSGDDRAITVRVTVRVGRARASAAASNTAASNAAASNTASDAARAPPPGA